MVEILTLFLHFVPQAYWAAGLHLFTPLPFRPGRGGLGDILRTHFFVNAGNIDNFDFSKKIAHSIYLLFVLLLEWFNLFVSPFLR